MPAPNRDMIALYPGTFDPVTNGHVDVAARAARLFDKLIVAVNDSAAGKAPLFDVDVRLDMVQHACASLPNVECISFTGLLADCFSSCRAGVVIRGLRAVSDFEYEFQLAIMNRRLNSRIETVFLTPSEDNTFLSSTLVREIAALGGDVTSFVSSHVAHCLRAQFKTTV